MTENNNIFHSLRVLSGLSFERLAQQAGASVWSLQCAENGNDMSLGSMMRIATYYGCSLHSLAANDPIEAIREMAGRKAFCPLPDRLEPEEGLTITNLEYLRLRGHISRPKLAALAGTTVYTIQRYELHGYTKNSRMAVISRLAAALDVTEDELLQLRSVDELLPGDRSRTAAPLSGNAVDKYRTLNNLTYRQLGPILGISYYGAEKVCNQKLAPRKYIDTLCVHDGISFADFMQQYGATEHAAVSCA